MAISKLFTFAPSYLDFLLDGKADYFFQRNWPMPIRPRSKLLSWLKIFALWPIGCKTTSSRLPAQTFRAAENSMTLLSKNYGRSNLFVRIALLLFFGCWKITVTTFWLWNGQTCKYADQLVKYVQNARRPLTTLIKE